MEGFVAPGQTLAGGKYRVERILGQGGMGVVVSALHVPLGQHVALKFLQPEMAVNPGATQRFLREARAAAQIQSEHVARVMDVGTLDFGAPYMVMELLRGADLARVLRSQGPLAVEQAVSYVLQACEAIAEAHSLGIIHRDVKPANLFLTQRADGSPLVKVLDFGISKAAVCDPEELQGSMTSTNAVMGSPRYMAPEQLRNAKDVDARADIWSIGIVLYELVAGVPPYPGETPWDLMSAIISEKIPALRDARPDAPAVLDRVITRCLEKDRERRFANLAELAQALREVAPPEAKLSIERTVRIIRGTGHGAQPSGDASRIDVSNPATYTASAWDSHPRITRFKQRRLGIGLAAAAGLALIGGAVFWLRDGGTPETVTAVSSLSSGTASTSTQPVSNTPNAISSPAVAPVTPAPNPPRVEPELPVPASTENRAAQAAETPPEKAPAKSTSPATSATALAQRAAPSGTSGASVTTPRKTSVVTAPPAPKSSPAPSVPTSKPRSSLTDLMQSRKPGQGRAQ